MKKIDQFALVEQTGKASLNWDDLVEEANSRIAHTKEESQESIEKKRTTIKEQFFEYLDKGGLTHLSEKVLRDLMRRCIRARLGQEQAIQNTTWALAKALSKDKFLVWYCDYCTAPKTRLGSWWYGKPSQKQIHAMWEQGDLSDIDRLWEFLGLCNRLDHISQVYLKSADKEHNEHGKLLNEVVKILMERLKLLLSNWEVGLISDSMDKEKIAEIVGPLGGFLSSRDQIAAITGVRVALDEVDDYREAEDEVAELLSPAFHKKLSR